MKNYFKITFSVGLCLFITGYIQAQNTFPDNGNVGVGTTTPNETFHIVDKNPSVLLSGETPNITFTTAPYTLTYNPAFIGITNEKGKFLPSSLVGDLIIKSQTNGNILFGANFSNLQPPIEYMRIGNDGFVGIGVTTPESRLHVDGTITTPSFKTNNKGVVKLRNHNAGEIQYNRALFPIYTASTNTSKLVINRASDFEEGVQISGPELLVDGSIGVGADVVNGYKLAVRGNILSEELKIRTFANWPDYVFDNDYKLKSLSDLENEIKVLGHLPNISSAKEVQENGFNLGEMNAKLLEKVEELTLYTINQQKEIEQLKGLVHKLLNDH